MTTVNFDRGRCLRYKSDLEKTVTITTPPPPIVTVEPTARHGSFLFWLIFSSILLLIVLLIRRQSENQDDEENDKEAEAEEEEKTRPIDRHESRPSAVRTLATIAEETSPVSSPSSPRREINEVGQTSLAKTFNRQAEEERVKEEIDGFVRIPSAKELEHPTNAIVDEQGHPIIFRKFCVAHENVIADDYKTLDEVNQAVKDVGLVRSQMIFGIDYTISNLETGKHSFNGLSLHHIQEGLLNPYQSVITIVGRTLEKYDSDTLIPAFGFGDRTTLDRKIFPLRPDGSYCRGFRGVLEAYNKITPKVRMSGPTNFAPLIKEAIRIVKKTGQYHILLILADGQVTNERQTREAIVEASHYPLSIIMIGVGDGPWDMMKEFDDSLPARQFDNFQFVNYNDIIQASYDTDTDFALHALMEIPSQYAAIKKLGLLKETND